MINCKKRLPIELYHAYVGLPSEVRLNSSHQLPAGGAGSERVHARRFCVSFPLGNDSADVFVRAAGEGATVRRPAQPREQSRAVSASASHRWNGDVGVFVRPAGGGGAGRGHDDRVDKASQRAFVDGYRRVRQQDGAQAFAARRRRSLRFPVCPCGRGRRTERRRGSQTRRLRTRVRFAGSVSVPATEPLRTAGRPARRQGAPRFRDGRTRRWKRRTRPRQWSVTQPGTNTRVSALSAGNAPARSAVSGAPPSVSGRERNAEVSLRP